MFAAAPVRRTSQRVETGCKSPAESVSGLVDETEYREEVDVGS